MSRNQQYLCLIKPCTRRTRKPSHKALQLYGIFADTAFRDCELYTLQKLSKEVLGDGCTDVFAKEWAESLFQEWQAQHTTLNHQLNTQTIPPPMPPFIPIEALQGSHADHAAASTIYTSSASSAPAVMANSPVGAAYAGAETPAELPVQPVTVQRGKPIYNYL